MDSGKKYVCGTCNAEIPAPWHQCPVIARRNREKYEEVALNPYSDVKTTAEAFRKYQMANTVGHAKGKLISEVKK